MDTQTNIPALAVGSKVVVVKGCQARGISKGMHATVLEVIEGERRSVKVRFFFPTAINPTTRERGVTMSLYAQHINRLADAVVSLNDGNPLHNVRVSHV
jgi:hypothetical protein